MIGKGDIGWGGEPSESTDRNLAYMRLAMSLIGLLQTGGSQAMEDAKTRTMGATGSGMPIRRMMRR